ncbi:MAG: hypothetical protein ACJAZ3_001666, partial [Sphingobacteriales bacterium]
TNLIYKIALILFIVFIAIQFYPKTKNIVNRARGI